MKIFFYFILLVILSSCCLGSRKCNQDNNSSRFRILDKTNGKDLVFGSAKIYDKSFITFYSLNGIDTIFHDYAAGPNPNPGQDSLLFVEFDYRKNETVFVKLSNTDMDTLTLSYQVIDASPCCADYTSLEPVSFNNNSVQQMTGGITILRK